MKYGIRIHVRSSFNKKLGTMVVKEENIVKKLLQGLRHQRMKQKLH